VNLRPLSPGERAGVRAFPIYTPRMNPWRRHRATLRARRINNYRKGQPLLECYKCGYDCVGITAERCPECGAAIDLDAPWWRDGRHSFKSLALLAAALPVISIAGYLWLNARRGSTPATPTGGALPILLAFGLQLLPVFVGMPILVMRARNRARSKINIFVRIMTLSAPLLIWLVILSGL